jgi:CheY-like chemotaxis protein/two-component sensor histidine kinase
MDRQLTQMERLIDDLLDIARITRNKLELRRQRLDLRGVIQQAVESGRPLAEAAKHEVKVELPAEPLAVLGDHVRLAQILGNLLSNAYKYTEPGGHVTVRARREAGEVVVSVKDDGIGIRPDLLPRVFDIFTQVDSRLERARGGLGLGLALVKRLVEMHGGSVEAFSQGLGRGSEFSVRLPALAAGSESLYEPAQREIGPTPVRKRILIVDDLRDSAESLELLLRLAGHETRIAFDGVEAVEVADAFRPDVVLLDLGMPRLDGFEACRRIRAQPWANGVLFVAVTGWGQDTERQRSREAGFDAHLVKPVDFEELDELLRSREE